MLHIKHKGDKMRKWKLSDDELETVKLYIRKKYNYLLISSDYDKWDEADDEWEKIKNNDNITVTMLQDWIEKYLTAEQINRLRVFLRVEKSRRGKLLKNITLTFAAHQKLKEFANSNNVTLSEAIEILIKKVK